MCKELHEKVGLDKTIKIIIEDGDPQKEILSWGERHVLNVDNRLNQDIASHPFAKISVSKGIQWSYISKNKLKK